MHTFRSASLSSRYLSNNHIQRLDEQNSYKLHQRRLSDIRNSISINKLSNTQHIKIINNLQKFKDRSKGKLQQQEQRNRQNTSIILKLKGIYQSKSNILPDRYTEPRKIISSRLGQKKKMSEKILQENLNLISQLKQKYKSTKQIKSRMKKQIKDYLSQRALCRHKILPKEEKKHQRQLSYSNNSRIIWIKTSQSKKSTQTDI